MTIVEPFSLTQILFEVTSAFGTVGLSLGITSEITTFSKIVLMILMFIGRVGIISLLFIFKSNKKVVNIISLRKRLLLDNLIKAAVR